MSTQDQKRVDNIEQDNVLNRSFFASTLFGLAGAFDL
jgi:hypothetical protein